MKTAGALRILIISSRFPYPATWGFARRVHHLASCLAADHEVTLLCYRRADDSAEDLRHYSGLMQVITIPTPTGGSAQRRLGQLVSLVSATPFHARHMRSAQMQHAVDNLLAQGRFDVVMMESSQMAWLELSGAPLVIDEHNIESELLGRVAATESSWIRRAFNHREQRRFRSFEARAWDRSAGCVTTSQRDAEAVTDRRPDLPVAVVPNCVDLDEFRPSMSAPDRNSLVFTGLLWYRPNADGIIWFLDNVWPIIRAQRGEAELTIVGEGSAEFLAQLRRPGVTATGWVTDVRPYMHKAGVVIVPLRSGGGTRLKVVEAMGMGKAIVSTTLGAEGIDIEDQRELLLRDDPEDFASAVNDLLTDPPFADRLGSAARLKAEQRYSWSTAAHDLAEFLRVVCRSAGTGGGQSE